MTQNGLYKETWPAPWNRVEDLTPQTGESGPQRSEGPGLGARTLEAYSAGSPSHQAVTK